jgi:hypothetical protein
MISDARSADSPHGWRVTGLAMRACGVRSTPAEPKAQVPTVVFVTEPPSGGTRPALLRLADLPIVVFPAGVEEMTRTSLRRFRPAGRRSLRVGTALREAMR